MALKKKKWQFGFKLNSRVSELKLPHVKTPPDFSGGVSKVSLS